MKFLAMKRQSPSSSWQPQKICGEIFFRKGTLHNDQRLLTILVCFPTFESANAEYIRMGDVIVDVPGGSNRNCARMASNNPDRERQGKLGDPLRERRTCSTSWMFACCITKDWLICSRFAVSKMDWANTTIDRQSLKIVLNKSRTVASSGAKAGFGFCESLVIVEYPYHTNAMFREQ